MNTSDAVRRYRTLQESHAEQSSLSFAEQLRLERHRHWCEAATHTLNGTQHPREVCLNWSLAAEKIIAMAWSHVGLASEPVALYGLGKLGARELNLSSDIDLIAISEHPCDAALESKVRHFIKLLSENTVFGFCFRVDFDLRPGGRFGPLVPSLSRVEDHYWMHGATWERLALVRARVLAGPTSLINSIEAIFEKFSYRRYIDYTLLEDLRNLRSDVFQHRPSVRPDSFHLKLNPGGIRDIELFIHALQVIHGGRNHKLRQKSTDAAAKELIKENIADAEDMNFLLDFYWELRDLENKAQAEYDAQTHVSRNTQTLQEKTAKVDSIVSEVVGRASESEGLPATLEEQQAWLKTLGYSKETVESVWPGILHATALSQMRSRDEAARQKVLRKFVELNQSSVDPDLGVQYLSDFMKSARAKASFFSLLLHEPRLLQDLTKILGSSPFLSQILVSRPELLDSVLLQKTGETPKDWSDLLEHLVERKLLSELFASVDFLKTLDTVQLNQRLSQTADVVFGALFEKLKSEHQVDDLTVVKLGKWASNEIGLHSDLDFIFVTDAAPTERHHKVAKRMISRLTEHHKGGSLYAVDLRLRPTGSAGPLMISKENLYKYIEQDAQPWERQSYYRCRCERTLQSSIQNLVLKRGFTDADLSMLRDVRQKLLATAQEGIDLKLQPGGLADIEFAAQIAMIRKGKLTDQQGTVTLLTALEAPAKLIKNYSHFRLVEQAHRLLTHSATTCLKDGASATQRLAKILKTSQVEFLEDLGQRLSQNSELLKRLDPIWATQ